MDPDESFAGLDPARRLGAGLSLADIAELELRLGASFPDDYRRFLAFADGWEGWLGDEYLALFGAADLLDANDAGFREDFSGLLAIGSNGGLETFALDVSLSAAGPGVVAIDRVSSDPRDRWPVASTFALALALRFKSQSPGDIPGH